MNTNQIQKSNEKSISILDNTKRNNNKTQDKRECFSNKKSFTFQQNLQVLDMLSYKNLQQRIKLFLSHDTDKCVCTSLLLLTTATIGEDGEELTELSHHIAILNSR